MVEKEEVNEATRQFVGQNYVSLSPKQIKKFKDKGADLDAFWHDGATLLQKLCRMTESDVTHLGILDKIKALLENGADPNIKDKKGRTIFYYLERGGEKGTVDKLKLLEKYISKETLESAREKYPSLVKIVEEYKAAENQLNEDDLEDFNYNVSDPDTLDDIFAEETAPTKETKTETSEESVLIPEVMDSPQKEELSKEATDRLKNLINTSHNSLKYELPSFKDLIEKGANPNAIVNFRLGGKKTISAPIAYILASVADHNTMKFLKKHGAKWDLIDKAMEIAKLSRNYEAVRFLKEQEPVDASFSEKVESKIPQLTMTMTEEKEKTAPKSEVKPKKGEKKMTPEEATKELEKVLGYPDEFNKIRELIKSGANVNTQTKYGLTLLYAICAPSGKNTPEEKKAAKELFMELLNHKGINPNLPNADDGDLPLGAAVLSQDFDYVRALGEHGANFLAPLSKTTNWPYSSWEELLLDKFKRDKNAIAFIQETIKKQKEAAEKAETKDETIVPPKEEKKMTPDEATEALKKLIDKNATPEQMRKVLPEIKALINHGANPQEQTIPGLDGKSISLVHALMGAADEDLMELLAQKYDFPSETLVFNDKGEFTDKGITSAHFAALANNEDALKYLANKSSYSLYMKDQNGKTAFELITDNTVRQSVIDVLGVIPIVLQKEGNTEGREADIVPPEEEKPAEKPAAEAGPEPKPEPAPEPEPKPTDDPTKKLIALLKTTDYDKNKIEASLDEIKDLVKQGADVSTQFELSGRSTFPTSVLAVAADSKLIESIEYSLPYQKFVEGDMDARSQMGIMGYVAAQNNNEDVLKVMADKFPRVMYSKIERPTRSGTEIKPLVDFIADENLRNKIKENLEEGHKKATKELTNLLGDPTYPHSDSTRSFAAHELIQKRMADVNAAIRTTTFIAPEKEGGPFTSKTENYTVAHWIAEHGDKKLLELADKNGIKWDVRHFPDDINETVVHMAAKAGNEEALNFFVEKGLDFSQKDKEGKTALERIEKPELREKIEKALEKKPEGREADDMSPEGGRPEGKPAAEPAPTDSHEAAAEERDGTPTGEGEADTVEEDGEEQAKREEVEGAIRYFWEKIKEKNPELYESLGKPGEIFDHSGMTDEEAKAMLEEKRAAMFETFRRDPDLAKKYKDTVAQILQSDEGKEIFHKIFKDRTGDVSVDDIINVLNGSARPSESPDTPLPTPKEGPDLGKRLGDSLKKGVDDFCQNVFEKDFNSSEEFAQAFLFNLLAFPLDVANDLLTREYKDDEKDLLKKILNEMKNREGSDGRDGEDGRGGGERGGGDRGGDRSGSSDAYVALAEANARAAEAQARATEAQARATEAQARAAEARARADADATKYINEANTEAAKAARAAAEAAKAAAEANKENAGVFTTAVGELAKGMKEAAKEQAQQFAEAFEKVSKDNREFLEKNSTFLKEIAEKMVKSDDETRKMISESLKEAISAFKEGKGGDSADAVQKVVNKFIELEKYREKQKTEKHKDDNKTKVELAKLRKNNPKNGKGSGTNGEVNINIINDSPGAAAAIDGVAIGGDVNNDSSRTPTNPPTSPKTPIGGKGGKPADGTKKTKTPSKVDKKLDEMKKSVYKKIDTLKISDEEKKKKKQAFNTLATQAKNQGVRLADLIELQKSKKDVFEKLRYTDKGNLSQARENLELAKKIDKDEKKRRLGIRLNRILMRNQDLNNSERETNVWEKHTEFLMKRSMQDK